MGFPQVIISGMISAFSKAQKVSPDRPNPVCT